TKKARVSRPYQRRRKERKRAAACGIGARRTTPATEAAAQGDGAEISQEEQLREIWREALHVDAVHDDDDFIRLGGHSLLALRVRARVREAIGVEITPHSCLRAQTFAEWRADVARQHRR
ncbi:phosphopantetheine-binding protein, partial [Streptomyces decoyicus]|uniref:phosphopantetheine-binding protein n=1 Tax=Streptomyces decoyicus TaxID=249567 RepID=UPI0033A81C04